MSKGLASRSLAEEVVAWIPTEGEAIADPIGAALKFTMFTATSTMSSVSESAYNSFKHPSQPKTSCCYLFLLPLPYSIVIPATYHWDRSFLPKFVLHPIKIEELHNASLQPCALLFRCFVCWAPQSLLLYAFLAYKYLHSKVLKVGIPSSKTRIPGFETRNSQFKK
ncbi:hypothetical protein M9H77_30543 [Catharanthus roseus]|uniref:Uncharacterized protein n=1 Tax=Catharanthus roseus TaxID=4058 RepID=A0ACC0A1G6_CATRO|nr:hypothetical protein M9H77_30543 [Catharanthus roseus]